MTPLQRVWRAGLRTQRRLMRRLPPELASRLDQLRPARAVSWGGPLNGQARRRELVTALARAVPFDLVVETGTHLGTSTEFFAATFDARVETVEAEARFFLYSQRRFAREPRVNVHHGDSRGLLRDLASQASDGERVFFYLDAHWEEDLPLRDELLAISKTWTEAVVMIDDFAVPGDEGYKFDDYGEAGSLTASYLPTDHLQGWLLAYPSSSSSQETGARRGSCVLVSPALRERVAALPELTSALVVD